jgi:hypothetical protein
MLNRLKQVFHGSASEPIQIPAVSLVSSMGSPLPVAHHISILLLDVGGFANSIVLLTALLSPLVNRNVHWIGFFLACRSY